MLIFCRIRRVKWNCKGEQNQPTTPNADISALTTAKIPVKQLTRRAKIELNRNGAKAKAATAIRLTGSIPPDEAKEVILNRPFVFAILHRTMNIPVFMGVVNRMKGDKQVK